MNRHLVTGEQTMPKQLETMAVTFGSRATTFSLGIDRSTGKYHRRPLSAGSFAWRASGHGVHLGGGREPRAGVNPDLLNEAGWGVVWADAATRSAVKPLLEPLLELRRKLAGDLYSEYTYEPGQSARDFLDGTNGIPGPADADVSAPYYLLLVGDPGLLPFEFQQQLDLRYAVGRLFFEAADDYAAYARAVVAAENGEAIRSQRASFFAVKHENDPVTELCVDQLVDPLADEIAGLAGWSAEKRIGPSADREALAQMLECSTRPSVLLAAGHSPVLPPGDESQRDFQGSIVTSEWPGPEREVAVGPEHTFTAADLAEGLDLTGLIVLLVGCYTGGTPRYDAFLEKERVVRAEAPFVARLAQALLARGAAGVVSHVDSLYLHSFAWPGSAGRPQHQTYGDMLFHLAKRRRLGHAMEPFGRRYGELAGYLMSARLQPQKVAEEAYAAYWIGYHDARQYVILGDPAARLALAPTEPSK